MKRILIISHFEICYNPRLLKAGDYLKSKGFEVVLFSPLTGGADKKVYENCISKRQWEVYEGDIRKLSLRTYLTWLYTGILFKVIRTIWKYFKTELGHYYFFNKGLLLFPERKIKNIDYILIHVIDSLPYAVKLKKKYNAKLIYDSQEYFTGQYANYPKFEHDWVCHFQEKYIKDVDILLATTHVMLQKIINDYNLKIPAFRVRNLPMKQNTKINPTASDGPLKTCLAWHVHCTFEPKGRASVILKALSVCKTKAILYLQGNINDSQNQILKDLLVQLNIVDKVKLLPAAAPDNIIDSLIGYDLGMIGELTTEENQILTSSNKLFEYICAGLAVVSPDIIGINETICEFNVGMKYPVGDFRKLAELIDYFGENRTALNEFKRNALHAASNYLYWEADYGQVFELIK